VALRPQLHAKAAAEQGQQLLADIMDERGKRRNARSTEDIEQALNEPPPDRTGWTPRWARWGGVGRG
jgi:hypothetical protein